MFLLTEKMCRVWFAVGYFIPTGASFCSLVALTTLSVENFLGISSCSLILLLVKSLI
jgi:hypothetical protein